MKKTGFVLVIAVSFLTADKSLDVACAQAPRESTESEQPGNDRSLIPVFDKDTQLTQAGTFIEDFQERKLRILQCKGDVRWAEGSLRIAEGAVIGYPVNLWPFLTIDVDLRSTTSREENEQTGSAVSFELRPDNAQSLVVSLEQSGEGRAGLTTIRISAKSLPGWSGLFSTAKPQLSEVRRFRHEFPLEGRWTIDYRSGMVVVSHNGKEAAAGFVNQMSLPVSGISMNAVRGTIECRQWKVTVPEHGPLKAHDESDVAEMLQMQRKTMVTGASGEIRKALQHATAMLEVCERVFGAEHQQFAAALTMVGNQHLFFQEYAQARNYLERALDINRNRYGVDHPETADLHVSMAYFMEGVGDWASAEDHCQRARQIYERVFGVRDRRYADILSQLARFASYEGESSHVRKWLEQAIEIYELTEEPESQRGQPGSGYPDEERVDCLMRLADHHERLGERSLARRRRQEAASLLQQVATEAKNLNALQSEMLQNELLSLSIQLGKAEQALRTIRGIMEKGSQRGRNAQIERLRTQLIAALMELGQTEEALVELKRELERNRQRHAKGMLPDSILAGNLFEIGHLYVLTGNGDKALSVFREALDISCRSAGEKFTVLSSSEMLLSVREAWLLRDSILSHWRSRPDRNARAAYQAVWKTHGFATQSLRNRWERVIQSPDTLQLRRELIETRGQLSNHIHAQGQSSDAWSRRLEDLTQTKENLERKLAATLSGENVFDEMDLEVFEEKFAEYLRSPEARQLAWLHFVKVSGWNATVGKEDEPPSYEAFVLLPSEQGLVIKWVPLGSAELIENAVQRWREQLETGKTTTEIDGRRPDIELRQLVWDPLLKEIGIRNQIVVIPSAELTRLPWSALPSHDGSRFLIEDFAIATMSYPQQIVEVMGSVPSEATGCLLLGGVDYNRRSEKPKPQGDRAIGFTRRATMDADRQWAALPGTVAEIEALQALWSEAKPPQLLTGALATEKRLLSTMSGQRYVHLATHGFFAKERFQSVFSASDNSADAFEKKLTGSMGLVSRNPLTLSGIVLAGANGHPESSSPSAGEDGILTAEEVTHLPLSGTELVVLSACETGLGKVAGGEGVLGLQRAFHLAGARAVIAGLWKVDDDASQALMVEFYRNHWQRGLSKMESLRQAQLRMLVDYDVDNRKWKRDRGVIRVKQPQIESARKEQALLPPYYWAGFTLSGDWR